MRTDLRYTVSKAKARQNGKAMCPPRFGTGGYYYAYHAGDGINLIRELDAVVSDGLMFVSFYWTKLGGKLDEVYAKLGTGAYIDEITMATAATSRFRV